MPCSRPFQASSVLLMALAGCGGSPPPPSAPPRTAPTVDVPSTGPTTDVPAAPATLSLDPRRLPTKQGIRFEPVVTYEGLKPKEECLHPFPGFAALDATAKAVWLVGACGVRGRFMNGQLERFPTKTKDMMVMPGAYCPAHIMHWSVWGASDNDAYLLCSPRCGPDPNAVWPNELHHFDGKAWKSIAVSLSDPHQADIYQLSGANNALWAIIQGDDWSRPPDHSILRIEGSQTREVKAALSDEHRKVLSAPASPTQIPNEVPYEEYRAIAAVSADEVWVAGTLRQWVQENEDGMGEPNRLVHGALWHYSDGAWSEFHLDGVPEAIAVAPDGTVWVGGDGLWVKRPQQEPELIASEASDSPLGDGVESLALTSNDDVWIALGCSQEDCKGPWVLHFDGTNLRRVESTLPEGLPENNRLSREPRIKIQPEGQVWLMSEFLVWKLTPSTSDE